MHKLEYNISKLSSLAYLKNSPLREFGEVETTRHYLPKCTLFGNLRESMLNNITSESTGVQI